MRWADMDMLGHINNVRYLDYVAEAREALLRGTGAEHARVLRHQVEFAAPLVFRRRPVLVDSWVTGVTDGTLSLAHEAYDEPEDPDGDRTVYLRVSSVLDVALSPMAREVAESQLGPDHVWRAIADEVRPGGTSYDLRLRRADLAEDGAARDVSFFEFFQEARIHFVMGLHTRGQEWSHHVVARTDIDFVEPVPLREAPYVLRSWVGHVGTKSFTVQGELLDDDRVLARANVVMVTFDKDTQRPREMAGSQRERLLEALGS
jgi:acyl-CoA thioester hydrolase